MVYDIFISFRGEDVRFNFIGYLEKALRSYGLVVKIFLDDKELLIGDRLGEKLEESIEKSRTSIVVLSENYATSKWCLRELVKIIESMDDIKNRVLPVFYHVDPSHVRNQSGTFEKSFDKYDDEKEKCSKEEVIKWKEALTKVGNLVGVVVKRDSPEVDDVSKITKQIFGMLRKPKLVGTDKMKNLVDMPSRLRDINNLLALESNDVRFIGIVGMGGIGKTTIAQVCYDNLSSEFDNNCCFLTSRSNDDLVTLQSQLLSRLLPKVDIQISHESEGANLIEDCLRERKVLIVLDGVNEKEQLQNLARSFDWFGPKSRIIITTRNIDVFFHNNHHGVQIYHVKPLDYESSFSLFCKHAFGQSEDYSNQQQFIQLSKEIVEKIEGHPLCLEQIGSSLYGQDIDVWREKLETIIYFDNKRVFDVLKISFDQLETKSQEAFLDLTCLFNGKSKGRVIEILRNLGYSPQSVLKLLCDRNFIEIKDGEIIYIPNLIKAMGQKIEGEAAQRSRIWLRQDAFDIFDKQHGVEHIKGVVLDNREKQPELVLKTRQLKEMSSLKILEIDNVKILPRNQQYLPNQLRLLHWHGYPSKSLPQEFKTPNLFELKLPLGQTTHLWKGLKRFEKLKVIDVSDSHYMEVTPDLSGVSKLERLILRNCIRLNRIDNSIISLCHLMLLDLTSCVSLKTFTSMRNLKSSTSVQLSGSGLDDAYRSVEANSLNHLQPQIGEIITEQPRSPTNTTRDHLRPLPLTINSECCLSTPTVAETSNIRLRRPSQDTNFNSQFRVKRLKLE